MDIPKFGRAEDGESRRPGVGDDVAQVGVQVRTIECELRKERPHRCGHTRQDETALLNPIIRTLATSIIRNEESRGDDATGLESMAIPRRAPIISNVLRRDVVAFFTRSAMASAETMGRTHIESH